MRALVIQHDDDGPAGHVSDWLETRGAEQDVYWIGADECERDPRAYDLVVSLGSEHAAYDDAVPWMGLERRLLADAAAADVAVLGICFGAQLLARALGGQAMRAPRPEIGWVAVSSRDDTLVEAGPWLQWHYDTFTPPPGAARWAESPGGNQVFTIGRSLGVQFHPEATAEIVGSWVEGARERLAGDGVDPDRVLAEMRERDAENRARAWRLLDAFASRVAGLG